MAEKVKVDITWSPEQKAMVKAYAAAKGMSFNRFADMVMREEVYKEKKNVRSRQK